MKCEKGKQIFSDRVAELNDLLENNKIDYLKFQFEHGLASIAFGITPISAWPCDPTK